MLTVIWSDFSFVSFKRLFQFFTIITVCFAVLLHNNSLKNVITYFKVILSIYLFLSIISVLLIPEATDPSTNSWRGLTHTKNLLGQSSLIGTIFWFNIFLKEGFAGKIYSFLMLLISLILLIGSMSMTSLLTFIIILLFGILFVFERKLFSQLGIRYSIGIKKVKYY